MGKTKTAIFLDVFKDENGKNTFSATRIQKDAEGKETWVENEKQLFTRAMNRKAKRAVAKQNRSR